MWTSTLDLDPKRVIATQLLSHFWRGACLTSFSPLRVENVPRQPLPASNWVRVRNRLAGICGSDLHLICADGDFRIAPAALPNSRFSYPGHEVVGEVIEVGEDVEHLHVGDRVVLQSGSNCLTAGVHPLCHSCMAGNHHLCERGNLPGPQPIGGGWSEEMLLHEAQLFRVSSALNNEQAVMLEPSAVALHAVLRHLPQAGDHVLIVGAGTIGLLVLQIVRALSPQAKISVLARYPFQVELATRMGAAHIIYPHDSYNAVKQATNAQLYHGFWGNKMLLGGYNVIYDTIGSRKTLHDALRWSCARATVVLIGLNLHLMHIDMTPVWYREINLLGTMSHGMENWPLGTQEQCTTFHIAEELIAQRQIQPEQLITHRFALNNYREALMQAINRSQSRAVKIVFDYSLLPASVVPNVRASARKSTIPASTGTIPLSPETPVPVNTHRSGDLAVVPPLHQEEDPDEVNEVTAAAVPVVNKPALSETSSQKGHVFEETEPTVKVVNRSYHHDYSDEGRAIEVQSAREDVLPSPVSEEVGGAEQTQPDSDTTSHAETQEKEVTQLEELVTTSDEEALPPAERQETIPALKALHSENPDVSEEGIIAPSKEPLMEDISSDADRVPTNLSEEVPQEHEISQLQESDEEITGTSSEADNNDRTQEDVPAEAQQIEVEEAAHLPEDDGTGLDVSTVPEQKVPSVEDEPPVEYKEMATEEHMVNSSEIESVPVPIESSEETAEEGRGGAVSVEAENDEPESSSQSETEEVLASQIEDPSISKEATRSRNRRKKSPNGGQRKTPGKVRKK